MDFRRCPDCSGVLRPEEPHHCPGTAAFAIETARICPQCGGEFRGEIHADCSRAKTIALPPREEIPAEVKAVLEDVSKRLHQYVLLERLGRGGMGEVWKAWDTTLTRWVAVKFLTLREEEGLRRFQREARLAARLRHPNIAAVFEVGEHEGRHFIAMEYIEGKTLDHARLPHRLAADVTAKVAHGLHTAHRAGVIHRDLKPSNIILTRENWPYILDFGLARSVEVGSSISVTGEIMGTPAYMSPEQARGRPSEIDPRADVYSLGATLYAMLTDRPPYGGETPMDIVLQVIQGNLVPPRRIDPKIPAPLEAIVLKAMARLKEERYASAHDFGADLERFLADQDITARPPSTARKIAKRARKGLWLVPALALGVAAAVWASLPPSVPVRADWPAIRGRDFDPGGLAFDRFDPADATLVPRIRTHLGLLSPEQRTDAETWFTLQTEIASKDAELLRGRKAEWLGLREPARKLSRWCETVSQAADGFFPKAAAEARRIRDSIASILAYRGEFTLQILVGAYPTAVVRNTRYDTPARLSLEIDDYEIELIHPDLGSKWVRIEAARLKPGAVCWIRGDMSGAEPLRVTP